MFKHLPEDRMAKLKKLEDAGINPWGGRYEPRDMIAGVRAEFPTFSEEIAQAAEKPVYGEGVRIAGRIILFRDFGRLVFFHIQDQSGRMQCVLNKKILNDPAKFKLWRKSLDLGDIIGVEGYLSYTNKGEPTLWARELTMLCKSLKTPPEKRTGIRDPELMYRKRYLHLMTDAEARKVFIMRSRIISATRNFMDTRGFLEIEGPILQAIPGGAAARPFVTHHNALDMKLYLRIATEIYLKMMLVGGMEKVYEIGRLFRNEGVDSRHNPEFTSIEFYQAYADLRTMMDMTEHFISELCEKVLGRDSVEFRGHEIMLRPPFPRSDYAELLEQRAGVKIDDEDGLRRKLREAGIDGEKSLETPEDLVDAVFGEYVETKLLQPTFVCRQPVAMAPLCKPDPDDPSVSDRFELYIGGMEIANAYSELNNPMLQRGVLARQAGGLEKGLLEGKIDETFLDALEHGMPPAGGEGMGIDRLVMLLAGRHSIRDVILFPLLKT